MGPTFSSLTMAAPLGSGGRKKIESGTYTAYHVGLVGTKTGARVKKKAKESHFLTTQQPS